MNVIIIEDESFSADHLEKMLQKYDSAIRVLAKLPSVAESVEWFREHEEPDLIFLDIHLEDDLSFAIFEKIKINSPIIFTTAYDEYAIKAFKMKSIDYLLKPIIREELIRSMEKFKAWNAERKISLDIQSLYDIISRKTPEYLERFSVSVGQKLRSIGLEEVAYFYANAGITFLVSPDKMEYPIDYSLDQLTERMDPKRFFRINRQFLINHKAIRNVFVYPKSRLKVELFPPPQEEVFVSIDKVTRFKTWFGS